MKYILAFITLVLLSSCSKKIEYYHGYIYSKEKKPLQNLKVVEDDNLKTSCYTDKNGYFKIPEQNNIGGNLIIYTENNIAIDTIRTVYPMHGERLIYSFVNGKQDTLYVSLPK